MLHAEVMEMAEYTVQQLAKLAGVSVRTLHYYDEIGLLAPSLRTAAGYRMYGERELLRLQQLLFFRELDVPLHEIGKILDDPAFDPVEALGAHRARLEQRLGRLHRLLATIDHTIARYRGEHEMVNDRDLYEGFSDEQIARYEREVRESYDPKLVAESRQRLKKLTKADWQVVKQQGENATRAIADLMHLAPAAVEVQQAVARHHAWINDNFYECSAETYEGLGRMYADSPDFRAYYDSFAENLADFMAAAMAHYARHGIQSKE